MKSALNLLTANSLWRIAAAFVIFFISYFLISIAPAHAEQPYSNEAEYVTYTSPTSPGVNPDVPLNLHNGVQIIFIEFLSTIQCQLTGRDPLNESGKCLGVDRKTGKIGFVDNGGGAIVVMGKLIDATFIPPASSMQYVAYLRSNFGITKSAYAQASGPCATGPDARRGVGFCAIEPLLPVWVAMRNIVYLLFILIFVVIGMGIMLRIHIDPRTVMTVQNQIPKIIVGIVAITFSFAIAGFLIDVMWVAIYLFTGVLVSATGGSLTANNAVAITQATDPFQAVNAAWQNVDPNAQFGIYDIASHTATSFSDIVEGSLQEFSGELGILWNIFGGALDIILTIILFIAILILLIRLFITLILSFINIILDIIFAPWWILAGLFPGGPLGLGAWIRDLIANLAVFPVAIGFMLLGSYLMNAFYHDSNQFGRLNLPLLGSSTNSQAIAALIGFGFILMLPNLLSTLKAALKTPKLSFGPLFGPVSSAGGIFTSIPRRGTQIAELQGRRAYAKEATTMRGRALNFFANPYTRTHKPSP